MLHYRFVIKLGENNQVERLIADKANVEFTELNPSKIIVKINDKYYEIKIEPSIIPALGMYERNDLAQVMSEINNAKSTK